MKGAISRLYLCSNGSDASHASTAAVPAKPFTTIFRSETPTKALSGKLLLQVFSNSARVGGLDGVLIPWATRLNTETCGDCKGKRERELKKLLENFNSKRSEFNQAHLCVLQNTKEFRAYFIEHLEYLKAAFPRFKKNKKWLKDKQNNSFADWVKIRVGQQLDDPESNISETVRWIAEGPSHEVARFNSYKIDGVQFYTKSLDNVRVCQNSGVYLEAEAMVVASARDRKPVDDDMSFYGVIDEIWELDYAKFRLPLFKCDWVESSKGVKVDDLGFTLVNLKRIGHLNDIFALATSVYQIFYVQDPVDPRWSVVLRVPQRDYNDLAHDDELGDTIIDHQPFTDRMPSIESGEGEIGYIRAESETILVNE